MNRRPGRLADRVAELEKRRPSGGRFYMIWGKDEAECANKLTEAKTNGDLQHGDRYDSKIWPHDSPMPPSRWTTLDQTGHEELRTICSPVEREAERAPHSFADQYSDADLCEIFAGGLPILVA
jgi:hypothetical protein